MLPRNIIPAVNFLIPVRHPYGCSNYQTTWSLLIDTLSSILRQDCLHWTVGVCANKVLPIPPQLNDKRIYFIESSRRYIGKSLRKYDQHRHQQHLADKAYKRLELIKHICNYKPIWYYMMDGDDLLAPNLVSSLLYYEKPDTEAIVVQGGIIYNKTSEAQYDVDDINQYCGSTVAVKASIVHSMLANPPLYTKVLSKHRLADLNMFSKVLYLNSRKYVAYVQHGDNHGTHWGYKNSLKLVSKSDFFANFPSIFSRGVDFAA
jgi:hypothetical protein